MPVGSLFPTFCDNWFHNCFWQICGPYLSLTTHEIASFDVLNVPADVRRLFYLINRVFYMYLNLLQSFHLSFLGLVQLDLDYQIWLEDLILETHNKHKLIYDSA